MKRIVSLLSAVLLLWAMVPLTASAATCDGLFVAYQSDNYANPIDPTDHVCIGTPRQDSNWGDSAGTFRGSDNNNLESLYISVRAGLVHDWTVCLTMWYLPDYGGAKYQYWTDDEYGNPNFVAPNGISSHKLRMVQSGTSCPANG
jgi:hypothetical protein